MYYVQRKPCCTPECRKYNMRYFSKKTGLQIAEKVAFCNFASHIGALHIFFWIAVITSRDNDITTSDLVFNVSACVCVCVCVCVWINKPKIGSGDIYLYRRVSGCDYFGRFVCLFRRVSKISFTARHCGPNSLEFSAWQFAWSSCWAWSVSTWLENASVWVTLRLV